MWQVTLYHFLLIVLLGLFLFWCLISSFGIIERRRIKRRSKRSNYVDERKEVRITLMYLFVLSFIIISIFIYINKVLLKKV